MSQAVPEPSWSEGEFVDNVRRIVRALMAIGGVDANWLGEQLGLDRNVVYSRLGSGRATRFTAAEIYRMAGIFEVSAGVFFEPADDLVAGFRKDSFSTPQPVAA